MSRAVFLDMSKKAVIAHCEKAEIGISSIGDVPTGGTRLVCMSIDAPRTSAAAEIQGIVARHVDRSVTPRSSTTSGATATQAPPLSHRVVSG